MCSSDGKRKICISGGSLHVGNMGCRALGASLIRLVEEIPNCKATLLYGNRNPGEVEILGASGQPVRVQVINYRMSPKSRLREHLFWILMLAFLHRFIPNRAFRRLIEKNPWIGEVRKAEFFGEITGGDSFADIYGLRAFLFAMAPSFIAILVRAPIVFLPQTYGPFTRRFTQCIARFILRRASAIFARDRQSLELAKALIKGAPRDIPLQLCPDVAFALEANHDAKAVFNPALPADSHEAIVGINISGLLYIGGYTRNNMFGLACDYAETVRTLIEEFSNRSGVRILLIPHTFESGEQSDQLAAKRVWGRLSEKAKSCTHILTGNHDQSEMKAIIGQCDFFIGSRMHACIAALSQGIPTVAIAYSRKFVGVFDVIGVAEMVLDAKAIDDAAIIKKCIELFESRDRVATELRHKVRLAQEHLLEHFRSSIFSNVRNSQNKANAENTSIPCGRG